MSSKMSTTEGFEPPIFLFEVRRLIRWAMRPCVLSIVSVACSAAKCCPLYCILCKIFALCQTKCRPRGIRTPNLLIRSHALSVGPCGHVSCQLYLLLVQLPSVVPCNHSISRKFPLCQAKSRRQRDSNPQSSDSKSDALSVGQCGHVSCQLYLLLVQFPSVVPCVDPISKKSPLCQAKCRPQRDSNPQSSDSKSDALSVGPCGRVSCQLYLLLLQLPSVVPCNHSILPLCQAKSRRQRDSNPQSSDSKSDALSVGQCGHVSCQLYLLLVQLPSVVPCVDSISKKFPLCQAKCRPQRGSNPQSSDSKSDALSVGPCGRVSCQLYLLLLQLPSVVPCNHSILRSYLCVKQKVDDSGIRTPNLLIRSQTPYPLGNAAMFPVNCICYLFSCQVLSLVLTPFLRSFLCVKQNVDHRGIRTPNLLIRSQTPYPLGHAAMCLVNCICCLFSCQVLSLILHPLKELSFVSNKMSTTRDSNPQSSHSKSRFIRWAMRPCVLSIVLVSCSVAKCCSL